MSAFEPRRIVVAADMSEGSAPAVRAARRLAEGYGAELSAVLVDAEAPPLEFTSSQVAALAREEERNRRALARDFGRWVQAIAPAAESRVVLGQPAEGILAAASDADLLVVGTHGRRGLARLALGSVSEAVIRQAEMPVLAVRATAGRELGQHVLCPVNFTPTGQAALGVALSVAVRLGGRLTVMTCCETGDEPTGRLHELLSAAPPGLAVDTAIRQGQAADQILGLAAETAADLIVVGARRQGSVAEAIFGTTTERLLRNARSSLLVVPAGLPDGVGPRGAQR